MTPALHLFEHKLVQAGGGRARPGENDFSLPVFVALEASLEVELGFFHVHGDVAFGGFETGHEELEASFLQQIGSDRSPLHFAVHDSYFRIRVGGRSCQLFYLPCTHF